MDSIRLLSVLVLSAPAFAQTTWYVDDDGAAPGTGTQADPYTAIQYAIDQPSTVSGDTLSIADGLYFGALDLGTKALALVGEPGLRPVIHGLGSGSTIKLAGILGPGLELRHLTITGGEGTPVGSGLRGGGVYIDGGSPRIVDCVIEGNEDCNLSGAGIWSQGADLELLDCILRDNVAGSSGGGVLQSGGTLLVDGCTFEDNSTVSTGGCGISGADGGAICVAVGSATIRDSVFRRNACRDRGGAVCVGDNFTTLDDCLFEDNGRWNGQTLPFGGGGVAGRDDTVIRGCVFRGNVSRERGGGATTGIYLECLFEDNRASQGGGLSAADAGDCVFLGNEAADAFFDDAWGGGAMTVDLVRCVLWGNRASGGAGGCHNSTADRCTIIGNLGVPEYAGFEGFILRNSIVWGNRAISLGAAAIQAKAGQPIQYCLIENHTSGGRGNLADQPLLWGLHVGDGHLLPGSPAIDAADPALPNDADGSRADIGALPYDPLYRGDSARYCVAKRTSEGCQPEIAALGEPALSGPPMIVLAGGVPVGQNALLLLSRTPAAGPFFGGTLCLGAPLVRATVSTSISGSGCGGVVLLPLMPSDLAAMALAPGDLLFAQVWFRDPAQADGTAVGLSDALVMTVQP